MEPCLSLSALGYEEGRRGLRFWADACTFRPNFTYFLNLSTRSSLLQFFWPPQSNDRQFDRLSKAFSSAFFKPFHFHLSNSITIMPSRRSMSNRAPTPPDQIINSDEIVDDILARENPFAGSNGAGSLNLAIMQAKAAEHRLTTKLDFKKASSRLTASNPSTQRTYDFWTNQFNGMLAARGEGWVIHRRLLYLSFTC